MILVGQLQAPKKLDRKWMNIKNISKNSALIFLCNSCNDAVYREVQNNEEIPNISRSKLYNVLRELKFK
jgi:hypothetical protein